MKTTSKRTYPTSWKDVPIVVDVPYVSILLGLHPNTVKKYIRQGRLKAMNNVGKGWIVNKSDLQMFRGLEVTM